MTSYSVMKAGPRFSVIATWPGSMYEHSAKVTTFDDEETADIIAYSLTDLSEAAWDSQVWLDAAPAVPPAIGQLVSALRTVDADIQPVALSGNGYRHANTWSFDQLSKQLANAPHAFDVLTRAQRLTVADEIELDAWHREQLMSSANLYFLSDSRVHQACRVSRVEEYGSIGPLPEGAAGQLRRFYAEGMELRERWGARAQIMRMEQLVAACRKAGGRSSNRWDQIGAHCVVASVPGEINVEDVPYFILPDDTDLAYDRLPSPHLPMQVLKDAKVIARVAAHDGDGFAAVLGDWTRGIPYTATAVATPQ